jgi:hypothetical protein
VFLLSAESTQNLCIDRSSHSVLVPEAAIAVPSLDKLPSVIDTLINAVRSGELDEQLAHASKRASARKKKAA